MKISSHFLHGDRIWSKKELAGIWISLGLSGSGKEVTSRKYVAQGASGFRHEWKGPITFDKVVVSKRAAGDPVDMLHNGKPITVPNDGSVFVNLRWFGHDVDIDELPVCAEERC